MTYWADNIRFIKEVQDSKYQKIEEAIDKVSLFLFNFFSLLYTNLSLGGVEILQKTDSKILPEVELMQILNCLKGNKPFTNMKHNCSNDIVCKKRATIQHN